MPTHQTGLSTPLVEVGSHPTIPGGAWSTRDILKLGCAPPVLGHDDVGNITHRRTRWGLVGFAGDELLASLGVTHHRASGIFTSLPTYRLPKFRRRALGPSQVIPQICPGEQPVLGGVEVVYAYFGPLDSVLGMFLKSMQTHGRLPGASVVVISISSWLSPSKPTSPAQVVGLSPSSS